MPAVPVTPPTPVTHALLGGVSADAIPVASELTIVPNVPGHDITIPAITAMHILFARDDSQSDITSIVDTADPTSQNQIGGWTKYGSTVNVGRYRLQRVGVKLRDNDSGRPDVPGELMQTELMTCIERMRKAIRAGITLDHRDMCCPACCQVIESFAVLSTPPDNVGCQDRR